MVERDRVRSLPGAFTLVELLVVIAIIGLLAAILLPVLSRARERARVTTCKSQLHQFSVAIETWRAATGQMFPSWLSSLYPVYMPSYDVYICPSDDAEDGPGTRGGVPFWCTQKPYEAKACDEVDDTDNCQASQVVQDGWTNPDGTKVDGRNPEIHRCSYNYEFTHAQCIWALTDKVENPVTHEYTGYQVEIEDHLMADGYSWLDVNRDNIISWREIKIAEQKGLIFVPGSPPTISSDPKLAYDGWVPMVRCFWHAEQRDLNHQQALNLASGLGNVYESEIFKEGWQVVAGR
jgi:prepilin-type N-terminal cleavage/methylation domain-containing protein